MTNALSHSKLDQPVLYRIIVKGRLEASWSDWFDGMTVSTDRDEQGSTVTLLTGRVADQVALHGLLARIRDLGLTLLSVECVETDCTQMNPKKSKE